MAVAEDIVHKYVESALKTEVLEDSFLTSVATNHGDESECPGVKSFLMTISKTSEPDKVIKHYVNLMAHVRSPTKFDRLFQTLRLVIKQHPNLGKAVCEALLSCENLDHHNHNSWMKSFAYIAEILPTVDYKGVRDILKYVLEIIYSLPERFDTSIVPQLDTLYATFSMILDREACLLPAYLGLDELQKKITQGNAPVWKFAELFYHFIESFRPTAQIFSISNRPELLPVVGFSNYGTNPSWRLDAISAKFQLKGLLPYKDKLREPQAGQVRYLLEQSGSRDMLCSALSVNTKPSQQTRCSELIEQIAASFIRIMERSPANIELLSQSSTESSERLFQWIHLSNNLFFYIQTTISFNHLIDSICDKLIVKNLRRGREHLMWALLQYITGSPKSSLTDFVAVTKLFDTLYPGRTPIPVPPGDSPLSPYILAAASVWLQVIKRSEMDQAKFSRPLPLPLQKHYEYLTNSKNFSDPSTSITFKDVAFLNAHGVAKGSYPITNIADLLSKCDANNTQNNLAVASPLPLSLLDTLTTHSKVALLHTLVQRILNIAQIQNKPNPQHNYLLTPALIETYGRLLIYTDSESFGVKTFFSHLINGPNAVWRTQAWHVYHVLLEMFNYRVAHIPVQYKFQMLMHLHSMSPIVYSANQMQLAMTMEFTELKLLLSLSNYEALNMPVTSRHPNDPKTTKHMINSDSEELNKILVLILARSTQLTASEHVTASFLEDILTDINKVTPLSWSSSTLIFFPNTMRDFFSRNGAMKEIDLGQLKSAVDEEYRKWKAINDDNNLLAQFSSPSAPPLFICVLWRILVDGECMTPVVYRILDCIKIRSISAQLRTFVDYLVCEFSSSGASEIHKYADALNGLIWKYHIITLDRILLCMSLRSFEDSKAKICFFIIQLLLQRAPDFKALVQKFCKMQTPEYWKDNADSFRKNLEFQRMFPERFYHEILAENNLPYSGQTLPSYFSNTCLRFIPVLDMLIHRGLELEITAQPNENSIKIETILDDYRGLYKFHEKPLTYLYETLHYYDSQLPAYLKRKLTSTIVFSLDDLKPHNWCLSESFTQFLQRANNNNQEEWQPSQDYFMKLIGRLVETLQGKNDFYHTDWRFNEFSNVKAHAIHATAIELMTLPTAPNIVGNAILDLVLTSYVNHDRSTMSQWMNAIGLIMTALPPSYYSVLNSKILEYMKSPLVTNQAYTKDILHLMNFCDSYERMYESQISYLVALTHAIWHHSNTGQIFRLPNFWKMEIKQTVETESQFLFACCLIGPFLQRFERSRVMMDVVVELYEMLGKVDETSDIQHLDTICDFFYHIKYMFTGDAVKNDIERCIRNFKPKLRNCLRFITHLNVSNN